MSDLLRADYYRIKKDIILIIALILVVFFSLATPVLFAVFGNFAQDSLGELEKIGYEISFTGKYVFESSLSVANNVGLILPVLIGILVCRDFSTGTFRNKVIAGHGRLPVYLSLMISAVSIGAALFLMYSLLSLAAGSLLLGYGSALDSGELIRVLKVLLMGTLTFAALMSLAVLLAAATRSVGVTIVLQIAAAMIISILGTVPMMLPDCPLWLERLSRLNPSYQMLLITSGSLTRELFITSLVSSAAYIIITVVTGALIFRRAELK